MIHDILVHVPTERVARPVVDASVSLTAGFGAHLDAVAICYVSASSAYVMDGGAAAIVATVFEMERERASQRAAAALEMFEIEARTAGISYQSRASGELPGDAAASIGTAACGRSAAGHGTRHFRQYRSSGNPVSVRWTGLVRASYLSRDLQSQAHRCLLGRKPAGRPRIKRCATVPGAGGCLSRNLHQRRG